MMEALVTAIILGYVGTFLAGHRYGRGTGSIKCPICKGTGTSGGTRVGFNPSTGKIEAHAMSSCRVCKGKKILRDPDR